MKADAEFLNQPLEFWANIRFLSQEIGYSKAGAIVVPSFEEVLRVYSNNAFNLKQIANNDYSPNAFGELLLKYFRRRKELLTTFAEPNLMDADQAREAFEELVRQYNPKCPIPTNKQGGDKKVPNYFTGIINTIIEAYTGGQPCDYDPRKLTSITQKGLPARTLSRRVDGAFPSSVNPVAIWEIKEYYYTTTFGSRIADGVYETQLDGMELMEARDNLDLDIKHYLMVDAYNTWWNMGKPYLCRMCDMLHMGITNEILFGKEVITNLPDIVREWLDKEPEIKSQTR